MIDKIKKTLKSVNEIESIKKELALARKEFDQAKKGLSEAESDMKKRIEKFDQMHKKAAEDNKQVNEKIKGIAVDFQKELNEFKTLRTKLSTEVVGQVAKDIRKEMDVYIMNIKQKIEKLNEAGSEIKEVTQNCKKMLASIDNIKDVSSNIKKEDFELSKYAHELRKNDKEKLNLMRKIDVLERLIAKQRRHQH